MRKSRDRSFVNARWILSKHLHRFDEFLTRDYTGMIFKKKGRRYKISRLASILDLRRALNFTGVIKNDFESRVCRQPINFSTPFLLPSYPNHFHIRGEEMASNPSIFPPPPNSIFSPLEKLRGGGEWLSGCCLSTLPLAPP